MTVYPGVDLHVRTQTVCWCDTSTGEIQQRTLDHHRDDVLCALVLTRRRVEHTMSGRPAKKGDGR